MLSLTSNIRKREVTNSLLLQIKKLENHLLAMLNTDSIKCINGNKIKPRT